MAYNPRTPGTQYRDVDGTIRTYGPTQGGFSQILKSGIDAFTPPASLFDPIQSEDFQQQAEDEVSPFYDKQLQVALKQLSILKEQKTALVEQQKKQQTEGANLWRGQEEFNFMNTLKSAQNGYAGRGTFGSGIQAGGMQNMEDSQQINVRDPFNLGQKQETENRDLGFSQFLQQNEYDVGKVTDLNKIDRNNAIQQNMRAIQAAEQSKKNFGINAMGQAFSQFLGNNQRLAA